MKQMPPFLKWAGGKRWFVQQHLQRIPAFPGRYIEPFVGSGAVFFALQPASAVLADSNKHLIETYRALKRNHCAVLRELSKHQRNHNDLYYYRIRGTRFRSQILRAAQLIYLNRTCWNGLYRVNRKGKFNVPVGTRTSVLLEGDDFGAISKLLKRATLMVGDFERIIDLAKAGDLLFVDPPYTVHHSQNGFIKYNRDLFSWEDQKRLRDALVRAKGRGARIMATNASHPSIRKLYKLNFKMELLRRNSSIAGQAGSRGTFTELLISSHKL